MGKNALYGLKPTYVHQKYANYHGETDEKVNLKFVETLVDPRATDCIVDLDKKTILIIFNDCSGKIFKIDNFVDYLREPSQTDKNKKEEKTNMFNKFTFDFGPVDTDAVRMSMYGIAIKNTDGKYVSYNDKTSEIMDVDGMTFPAKHMLFKMPVAVKDISMCDTIIHNHVPMYVVDCSADGSSLKVVDVRDGTIKEIMPARNMFGFNYVTKIVSLIDMSSMKTTASADNPFGNMLPLMLMSDEGYTADMLPMMMLMGNGGKIDPMMMMMLMGDKSEMKDMLPMMLMMNMNK